MQKKKAKNNMWGSSGGEEMDQYNILGCFDDGLSGSTGGSGAVRKTFYGIRLSSKLYLRAVVP